MQQGTMQMAGRLGARKISNAPPIAWRIKNTLRWAYVWGWLTTILAHLFSKITGIVTLTSELRAILFRKDGTAVNYGVVSRRVVTDAGVAFLAAYWAGGASSINIMKYAGCGTGTGDEAVGDTALGTECTTALNPDSTRATCTMTNPSAPVVQAVGTLTFDAIAAVTEHGLFSQAATGGGTLWDRSKFSAINVASGDSIQFTYQLTLTSGG